MPTPAEAAFATWEAALTAQQESIEQVLRAGNNLAEELYAGHPPYSCSVEEGREWYFTNFSPAHWTSLYNKWLCWRAIMRLRDTNKACRAKAEGTG